MLNKGQWVGVPILMALFAAGSYFGVQALRGEKGPAPAPKLVNLPQWQPEMANVPAPAEGKALQPEPAPEAKPMAAPPLKRALGFRAWDAPCDAGQKFDDLLNPSRIYDLAFDRDGKRLVSVSKRDIQVWDLGTKKLLFTFKAEQGKSPAVSKDGRYVAIPTIDSVSINSTATGLRTGQYTMPGDRFHKAYWMLGGGAFSPSGEWYIAGGGPLGGNAILAVESKTGQAKRIYSIPGDAIEKFEQIEPIPGSTALLLNGRIGKITAVKKPTVSRFAPETGKLTDLPSLSIKPWTLDHNRGMRISNDGSKVAAYDDKQVLAVDRVTDRELFRKKEGFTGYSAPTFTPDCKRFLYVRHPHYHTINFGEGGNSYPPDTVELCDASTGKKIASFAPESQGFPRHLTALEISHDGKTLAVADGTKLAVFDFEAAFGVAPLPPIPLPTKAESYRAD